MHDSLKLQVNAITVIGALLPLLILYEVNNFLCSRIAMPQEVKKDNGFYGFYNEEERFQ